MPPSPVARAEGLFGDVCSFDNYWEYLRLKWWQGVYDDSKLPQLVGEFCFRAKDSGLPNNSGGGELFDTQAERANAFQQYVEKGYLSPYAIGIKYI